MTPHNIAHPNSTAECNNLTMNSATALMASRNITHPNSTAECSKPTITKHSTVQHAGLRHAAADPFLQLVQLRPASSSLPQTPLCLPLAHQGVSQVKHAALQWQQTRQDLHWLRKCHMQHRLKAPSRLTGEVVRSEGVPFQGRDAAVLVGVVPQQPVRIVGQPVVVLQQLLYS
jgi:hypothetical protein